MAKEGTIKIRLTGDSSEAEAAIENVGTSAGKLESIFQGVGQHLGSALTDGLGVITDQIGAAMDIGAGKDKLQAQLGLSAEDADRYGKIAGDLYKGAWGDSLDDVNNTLALITQNIGEGNDEWLKSTAALTTDFAATFGQDAEGITSAIATMLNTGIAQSSEEAFDILTKGMQSGANKADDLLDTFTEYPTLFRELGLNGTEAMGLISQSLQAGARDSDFVADALKEFSLRAKNGSETTAEGFKAIGLNAEQMGADVAAGGDRSRVALDSTLEALRQIEDPVKRDAAAVALFGTKAEDLGDALFAMDPSFAAESLGQVTGAAQEMSDTLSSNTKTSLEAYKRQALMGIANILVNNVVPAVLQVIAIFQAIAGYINENREYFLVLAGAILAVLVPSLWAWVTAQWALVAAQIASAAAFIAANAAIILIIAAIAAMVAGVIYAYKHWGWFKTAVDAVVDAFKVAVAWIGDHVIPVIADIVTVVGQVISTLWNLSQTAWDVIQKVVGFFGGLSSGIANVIGGVTEALLSPFRSAFNAIANLWNNTVGRISFNVPGWVPGIGGKGFDVPDIPTFADGGLAFSPMLAIVGDHKTGGAEIITPEDKMRQIFREEGGTGINIGTVNVTNGDWGSMNKEIDFQWRVNRGRGAA